MKLSPKKRGKLSATLTQTLGLMAAFSGLLVVTAWGANPGWWSGVLDTNPANDYAVANQGQLKYFTKKAVANLNTTLSSSGGAGPTLSNLVYGWQQDYATNGYSTNTTSPSYPYKQLDYQAVNVGQLKYIGALVWNQLTNSGYGTLPSWLASSNAADSSIANLGQLKTVFNFDLSLAGPSGVTATPNTNGMVNVSWTLPPTNNASSLLLERQGVNGNWIIVATLSPSATSYAVTGLAAGENPTFQIIARHGNAFSVAQQTANDPGIVAPSNVYANPGQASGEIDVTWQNNSTDATYITINKSTDNVHWSTVATIAPTNTYYAVTNLTVGQSYYFDVGVGNN